jgi:hypothetical protein
MTKQKVENFDTAIHDARSMFSDFIFNLKKNHINEKIVSNLSVETYRWEECGQERCRIELIVDWSNLGMRALERDFDDNLIYVTRSTLLMNFFKKVNRAKDEIDNVQLIAYGFECHGNVMKQGEKVVVCEDEEAVPVWNGDQWFEKATQALRPVFNQIGSC